MQLTLSILRCPDAATPEVRRSAGADLALGRGPESDWVLADPDRVLSKRHCVLEYRGGYWQVRDLSTNGTFVNHAADPVGRDLVVPLNDGDRLRLGGYEIEVRVAAGTAAAPDRGWGAPALGTPISAGGGRAAPDPFAEPLRGPPTLPGAGPALPDDFDPFAEDAPMPDHRPAASDAFLAPRASPIAALPDDWGADFDTDAPAAPPPKAQPTPGIPEDWDVAFAPAPPDMPPQTTPAQAASRAALQAAHAASAAALGSAHAASAAALQSAHDAARSTRETAQEASQASLQSAQATSRAMLRSAEAGTRPTLPPETGMADAPPDPFAEPAATPPMPPTPRIGATAASDPALLTALLRGAGVHALPPGADADAVLEAAGTALRAAVTGLRALLIARADVKREFRIEQTMLRAAGNNPLKFAATDDAAILALLTAPGGARAVAETVADLTAHEVATLAATQAAARALLARLAPEGLEADSTAGGLFAAREKKLWEAYRRLHATVTAQFEDDFDSAFGKAFARAYEEASRRT